MTDPESFASLILVDKAWRAAAQTPHLYAHHLSRCPSFSLNHNVLDAGPFTDESLPRLKKKFAQEVKRNLFEAYLQPKRTIVSLISTTTSSSAAFPGGEAFEFIFSPNGHWTLALSSSRIYVLDTVSPEISVQRELKVLRRPVSAAILDDGSQLAVLSSNHQIHIYGLASFEVKHLRSIPLENAPHTIALAPKGDVIAAAYEGGVEILTLSTSTTESDWRIVKCDRVDSLRFSSDGTMLLGTTRNSKNPSTVILTAPYFTDDNQDLTPLDQTSTMWTSQIIFPNSSRDCSHATLLPQRTDGDANWMFTYDRVFESFRAVRTDDLRNGTTYFTGPRRPKGASNVPKKKLNPCTLPTANDGGELVAAGFLGKEVWLYGVPDGLDIAATSSIDEINPQSGSSGPGTPSRTPSAGPGTPNRSMTRGEAAELTRLPKWQVLVDKYRNVFAKGRKVAEIAGVSALTWVSQKDDKPDGFNSLKERLVIAAPGGIPGDPNLEQDGGLAAIDGGRLVILDFDRTTTNGQTRELTFDLGTAVPELLKEEDVDMDTEVALARRRTVAKAATDRRTIINMLGPTSELPAITLAPTANLLANLQSSSSSSSNATASASRSNASVAIVTTRDLATTTTRPRADSLEGGISLEQATEFFDGPYSHTQPRSPGTLYRSATAVAANRQRNPPRLVPSGRVEYRRPDGRGELPHESDADNWVPPPPPYAPQAEVPLPDHLRQTLLPSGTGSIPSSLRPRVGREGPQRANTMYEALRRSPQTPSDSSAPLVESESGRRHITRSASDNIAELSRPVSPVSTHGLSMGNNSSQVSIGSRRSNTTSSRRPVSEMVGRLTGSLRRPSTGSPAIASSANAPPVPMIPRRHRTAPVTPRPRSPTRPFSPALSFTGSSANLQPFATPPPASTRTRIPGLEPTPYQETAAAIGMPSAQQLSNLSNRTRQAPPPHTFRQTRVASTLPEGSIVPAPPRGARGAAGSRTSVNSPAAKSPTRSGSQRSSFSRSSPALLRPANKRLDTIESISSFISRPRTRSRSRPHTAASSTDIGRTASRRSVSAGPVLVLDRAPRANADSPAKKGFLGKKKSKGAIHQRGEAVGRNEDTNLTKQRKKGARCTIM